MEDHFFLDLDEDAEHEFVREFDIDMLLGDDPLMLGAQLQQQQLTPRFFLRRPASVASPFPTAFDTGAGGLGDPPSLGLPAGLRSATPGVPGHHHLNAMPPAHGNHPLGLNLRIGGGGYEGWGDGGYDGSVAWDDVLSAFLASPTAHAHHMDAGFAAPAGAAAAAAIGSLSGSGGGESGGSGRGSGPGGEGSNRGLGGGGSGGGGEAGKHHEGNGAGERIPESHTHMHTAGPADSQSKAHAHTTRTHSRNQSHPAQLLYSRQHQQQIGVTGGNAGSAMLGLPPSGCGGGGGGGGDGRNTPGARLREERAHAHGRTDAHTQRCASPAAPSCAPRSEVTLPLVVKVLVVDQGIVGESEAVKMLQQAAQPVAHCLSFIFDAHSDGLSALERYHQAQHPIVIVSSTLMYPGAARLAELLHAAKAGPYVVLSDEDAERGEEDTHARTDPQTQTHTPAEGTKRQGFDAVLRAPYSQCMLLECLVNAAAHILPRLLAPSPLPLPVTASVRVGNGSGGSRGGTGGSSGIQSIRSRHASNRSPDQVSAATPRFPALDGVVPLGPIPYSTPAAATEQHEEVVCKGRRCSQAHSEALGKPWITVVHISDVLAERRRQAMVVEGGGEAATHMLQGMPSPAVHTSIEEPVDGCVILRSCALAQPEVCVDNQDCNRSVDND